MWALLGCMLSRGRGDRTILCFALELSVLHELSTGLLEVTRVRSKLERLHVRTREDLRNGLGNVLCKALARAGGLYACVSWSCGQAGVAGWGEEGELELGVCGRSVGKDEEEEKEGQG